MAQKVHLEYVKTRPVPKPVPQPARRDNQERDHECLDRCVERLDAESRKLILGYYEDEKRAKIDRRRKLAEDLGITLTTLRMRAHRIKAVLQQCVADCLKESPAT